MCAIKCISAPCSAIQTVSTTQPNITARSDHSPLAQPIRQQQVLRSRRVLRLIIGSTPWNIRNKQSKRYIESQITNTHQNNPISSEQRWGILKQVRCRTLCLLSSHSNLITGETATELAKPGHNLNSQQLQSCDSRRKSQPTHRRPNPNNQPTQLDLSENVARNSHANLTTGSNAARTPGLYCRHLNRLKTLTRNCQ